jgi:hypothetical protein
MDRGHASRRLSALTADMIGFVHFGKHRLQRAELAVLYLRAIYAWPTYQASSEVKVCLPVLPAALVDA